MSSSRGARGASRAGRGARNPWPLLAAEFVGTAVLVLAGLSIVILDFAPSGPVAGVLDAGARRAMTGFLFGTVGALIAVSPVGKVSGAHINPIVTMAFVLRGRMRAGLGAAYVAAQLAGAVAGGLLLIPWGAMGREVRFGATIPGPAYGPGAALAGEAVTSFALIVLLFAFLGHRRLRAYTPLLFPVLYAVMVLLEAPVSGTSTNPARSLGPAVVADVWTAWWAYWIGPAAGALLAVLVHRLRWLRGLEIEVAKVYHFEQDRFGFFRGDD